MFDFGFDDGLFFLLLGVIRKVSGGWAVFSENGRRLSKVYKTKAEATKRLQQIEFFKKKSK